MFRFFRVFVLSAAVAGGVRNVHAQDARIPLNFSPGPDQVIHLAIAQDSEMQVEGTPVEIQSTARIGITQKTGSRDERGGISSVLTYDEFTAAAAMNGNPVPVPAPDLTGRSFTVAFDRAGTIVDAQATNPADAPLAGMVRAMVEQLYRGADESLGIGETATIPFTTSASLPGLPPGTTTEGKVTMKLLSVDRAGTERIAHFEQKMESSSTGAAGGPGMSLAMAGTGTLDWNLDHGYIKAMQTTVTLDGDVMAQRLHGTLNTKIAGSN